MKVVAIALNTYREAIRNKVLYSIFMFACLVTGISAAFGWASIGDTIKFAKDFSLFSLSLFGVVTTVVLGVSLLSKELGKRTIYNLLSKPVGRWQFVMAKFVGLVATLVVMMTLMTVALLILFYFLEDRIDWWILPTVAMMLLELAMLSAVAIFFSSIVVTPALAGLFTAAAFVAGRSVPMLKYLMTPDHPPTLRYIARGLHVVLPHLDQFYIADRVAFGMTLSPGYYLYAGLYATAYTALLLIASILIFQHREFA